MISEIGNLISNSEVGFYVNLPLGGLVGLFIAVIAIPDQIEKERVSFGLIRKIIPKFDLTGFALFTPASVMLLLALQFGSGEYGWNSPTVIGLFCGAGAVALLFIAWEWRVGDEAMIPLKLVSQTVVWTSSLNFAFLMSVTVGASNFLPIYFQSVKGLSPTMSAVYMLAGIISQLIFLLFSGALSMNFQLLRPFGKYSFWFANFLIVTKLGYYIPWALFAAGGTAIGCGLISTWAPGTTLAHLIGFQILYGFRGAGIQIVSAIPPTEPILMLPLLTLITGYRGTPERSASRPSRCGQFLPRILPEYVQRHCYYHRQHYLPRKPQIQDPYRCPFCWRASRHRRWR